MDLPVSISGSALNCLRTSSTILPAALETPFISCPVIINGTSPPTSSPTITAGFVRL